MLDYKELNLKIGLEIHRQIESHKLFCQSPSILSEGTPDLKLKRYLLPVASELDEEDKTALFELQKGKYAIYESFNESSCLVELDEEPIHPINQHALKTALQVAILLKAKIVDEIQIMRKQVLDYSNTSGFQRSMLIARNGSIELNGNKITIPTIYLEEDAARKIEEKEEYVTYRLDRLGTPLIELSTGPEIKTPEQAKEVASYLGMTLKSTGCFKSGLGTVRQDINLSIKGGARVELKGVQDLRSMPIIIEKEIERQLDLIKKDEKVESGVRRVLPNLKTEYMRPLPGSSRLYVETDHPNIPITKELLKTTEIPELLTDRAINFEKKYNLPSDYAREIISENIPFDYYAERYKIEPKIIANLLIEIPKEIKSRFKTTKQLQQKDFEFIFKNLEKNKITKEAAFEILKDISLNIEPNLEKYQTTSLDELELFIKDLVNKNKGVSISGLMGDIMKKYRGKIEGKLAIKILKKYIK